MELLQRLKFIIRANVNDKMSKIKNGNEKEILNTYIQSVKESLRQINSESALIEAKESVHFNKLCENQSLYEKYSRYASEAKTDIEAKRFLVYCDKLNAEKTSLEANYENAKENTVKSKEAVKIFVEEAEKILERLEDMKIKISAANQSENINKSICFDRLGDFEELFDEIQNKIYYNEAIAKLNSTSKN